MGKKGKPNIWKKIRRLLTWSALLGSLAAGCVFFSVYWLKIPDPNDVTTAAMLTSAVRGVLINLASTLVGAAVSVLLYRFFLMSDEDESREIERRCRAIEQDRIQSMQGLEDCLSEANSKLLADDLSRSDVFIVNTFLNGTLLQEILPTLRENLISGRSLMVALIHPDSKVVEARAAGSHYSVDMIQTQIAENIASFKRLNKDLPVRAQKKLKVFFFDRHPMAAYLSGKRVQISFFLTNAGTSGSPQCVFNLKEGVGITFKDNVLSYFNRDSKPGSIDLNMPYEQERIRTKALLRK